MATKRSILVAMLKSVDLLVIGACLLGAFEVARRAAGVPGPSILDMRLHLDEFLLGLVILAICHFVLAARGLYESYRLASAARRWRDLAIAIAVSLALIVPPALLVASPRTVSIFLGWFGLTAFLALGVTRAAVQAMARTVRRRGHNMRNVIIVGTGDRALELASQLAQRDELGYRVVGVIDSERDPGGQPLAVDAVVARLQELIDRLPIDETFFAVPIDASQPLLAAAIAACEDQGIAVRVLAQVTSLRWSHATVDSIAGQPVLTMESGHSDALGLFAKRLIDVTAASVGIIALLPVFAIIALIIRLDSPGPVIFAQERVGHCRRRFAAYKFRTMVPDAERLQASLETRNEAQGPVFKITHDPRITRIGGWLRRSSLDELPQLFNVLRGDMSLVGPRPLPVRDADRIDVRWHQRRFAVKPGITCLWQVNSREPRFDEWVRWDLEYIDNWSLALDFKILMKTVPAVLSGQGAR